MRSAAQDIDVETVACDKALVVRVHGDVDLWTAPVVRAALLAALERPHLERLVLDLGGVSQMDSSGISTLLEGRQLARRRKTRFLLAGVRGSPQRVLRSTRLWTVFENAPSVGAALR